MEISTIGLDLRTFFRFTESAQPVRLWSERRCGEHRCCRFSRSCHLVSSVPRHAERRIIGRVS